MDEAANDNSQLARVIYCGGRDYHDLTTIHNVMKQILAEGGPHIVVSGGANGADKGAEYCGGQLGLNVEVYPAKWKELGKSAGIVRNLQMINLDNVALVVVFPGGRGTAHMKETAIQQNVPVFEIYSLQDDEDSV